MRRQRTQLNWPAGVGTREALVVAAILILALVARLPGVLNDGLWRDEANVYVQLTAPTFGEFFHRVTSTEWHPPLFFLLMYGWSRLVGTGEFALTSIPFACSIATVAAVYVLGRSTGSLTVGAVAATLYAIAPVTVAYAGEYVYPVMGLFATLLGVLVIHARREPLTTGRWLWLAAVTMLVVLTHYIGCIYVAALCGWILISPGALRRRLVIGSALVAGAAPFIFWLPVFLTQRRIGVPYSAPSDSFAKPLFFVRALAQFVPVHPMLISALFVALIMVGVFVLARARMLNRDALGLGFVFLTVLAVTIGLNLTEIRYALPYFGLACVALASILTGFTERLSASQPADWRRWGIPVASTLVLVCIAVDLTSAFVVSRTPKSGIRSIALAAAPDPARLYVLAPDYLAATFAFYGRASRADFGGFVRWDRPEIFVLKDYAADWNRADAVVQTLKDIVRAGSGKTKLDVIVDDNARDAGQVPYGRVQQLLNALAVRYRPMGRIRHPGRNEAVSEYLYAL